MTAIQSEITGIKKKVQDQFSDIISGSDSQTSNDSGWKELLSSVKNNTFQYKHINPTTTEKYFNPNARIIENPLESSFQYRICNNCGKPLALNAIMEHIENYCKGPNSTESPNNLNKDLTDEDIEISTSFKKKNNNNSSAKRFNEEEDSPSPGPENKRFKESSGTPQETKRQRKVKQRNPTEKHLIDFDKQCGVNLPEGGYCARSLTCKSHSMGAKRSVDGRSQPFDVLLADYHKQHQTKIGAAAEKRAKQQEIQKHQKQIQKEQKKQMQQQRHGQRSRNKNNSSSGGYGNNSKSENLNGSKKNANNTSMSAANMNLTPEEETTQVLNGVSRSFPLPLESNVLSSVRGRTKYFRMREMFASAFSVKPGYTSPGYGAIHSRVGCIDLDRTTDYKFRIRTPQPINQLPPQSVTPQQIQKLQQQRMLQAQMINMQQENHAQQNQENRQQQQQLHNNKSKLHSQFNSLGSIPQSMNTAQKPPSTQDNGLTPQGIQQQQQKLRQQQIQQQRFEAAAFHLANATKLMQNSNVDGPPGIPETPNNIANSPPAVSASSANQSMGSPVGGRVNVGIGNTMSGYGGRVN